VRALEAREPALPPALIAHEGAIVRRRAIALALVGELRGEGGGAVSGDVRVLDRAPVRADLERALELCARGGAEPLRPARARIGCGFVGHGS
jgi:hypothetical protein